MMAGDQAENKQNKQHNTYPLIKQRRNDDSS